jgi:hypothetical protein
MKTIITALVVLFSVATSYGIVLSDGTSQTNMPSNNRGQNYIGLISSTNVPIYHPSEPTTAISSNAVVSAEHSMGIVGDVLTIGGRTYTITNRLEGPKVTFENRTDDVVVFQVSGRIPATNIAKLYTKTIQSGQTLTMFGCGVFAGKPIYRPSGEKVITNFVKGSASNSFNIIGGKFGERIEVQGSTNLTVWSTLLTTVFENEVLNVKFPKPISDQMFYRIKTIDQLIGYELERYTGTHLSWGTTVLEDFNPVSNWWTSSFKNDGCSVVAFDSSGGGFINDNGTYKLATVNLGSTTGPWTFDWTNWFNATILDQSGLNGTASVEKIPGQSFFTPLPVQWLKDHTGAK